MYSKLTLITLPHTVGRYKTKQSKAKQSKAKQNKTKQSKAKSNTKNIQNHQRNEIFSVYEHSPHMHTRGQTVAHLPLHTDECRRRFRSVCNNNNMRLSNRHTVWREKKKGTT